MNEALIFISAYFPAVGAVLGCIIATIVNIKRVKEAVEKSDIKKLKDDTKLLYKHLQEQIEANKALRDELHSLKLELRGIKSNEKVRKN